MPTATRTSIPTKTPPVTATGTPVSQEMMDGILAGNQVVRAIEDYYLNMNRYPTSLTDLIPTYLPGLPVTPDSLTYTACSMPPVRWVWNGIGFRFGLAINKT
jgi:hypothetical protein